VIQPWEVVWSEPAIGSLERLDNRSMDRLIDAVNRLAHTNAGDVRRLQGVDPPEWRLRVGSWRVRFVFAYPEHTLGIIAVAPRGSAY
jgi:mRNA interferase RelE/StbE